MPPTSPLINVADPGILQAEAQTATFLEFDRAIDNQSPIIQNLYAEVQSNKANEDFAIMESLPLPSIWNRGEARRWTSLEDVNINIVNRKWQLAIGWQREDREDAQVQSILDKARAGGRRFAQLDERVGIQLITSGSDNDLLPSVPNAYDGTALFSGSSRFGAGSGNQVSGSGVATVNAIITDLFAAQQRFGSFQDTEGEPFFQPEDIDFRNFRIIAPNGVRQVFTQALRTKNIPASGTFSDGSNNLSNATIDNPFLVDSEDMGAQIYFTQRLSDVDDWYVYLDLDFVKPLVKLNRIDLEPTDYRAGNSDWASEYDMEGVAFRMRRGYGVGAPQCMIQVTNS